jgi:hypothetical protein
MAIDGAGMQPKRRSKLSPLLRWAQLALFTLFFADTYVYRWAGNHVKCGSLQATVHHLSSSLLYRAVCTTACVAASALASPCLQLTLGV